MSQSPGNWCLLAGGRDVSLQVTDVCLLAAGMSQSPGNWCHSLQVTDVCLLAAAFYSMFLSSPLSLSQTCFQRRVVFFSLSQPPPSQSWPHVTFPATPPPSPPPPSPPQRPLNTVWQGDKGYVRTDPQSLTYSLRSGVVKHSDVEVVDLTATLTYFTPRAAQTTIPACRNYL